VAYEFKLPDLGEGLSEGEVARWLVSEGQEIAEDEPLVEIQTDKTTVEIPSPAAGTVTRIFVAEGAVVPVGTVLVVIGSADRGVEADSEGGSESTVTPQTAPAPRRPVAGGQIQATPLVRRLAAELGVDLTAVAGSGPTGRIVESDVRAADSAGTDKAPQEHAPLLTEAEGRREPVRGVRRRIIEHLTRAHREVPAVTFVEECDFTGVDLQLLIPLALKATAEALKHFPELNARLETNDDGTSEIVYLEHSNLGVAVQTEQGLVVPVVQGCDSASLEELATETARLAEAARSGSLKPAELRGGTFTITSAGKLGGVFVTPLVNHPEVAILGIHRIAARPVVHDGHVAVRDIGNVSVTFDHRVVDGARAAAFCLDVVRRLEASQRRVSAARDERRPDEG